MKKIKQLRSSTAIVSTAAFLTLTANTTFFSEVAKVYPLAHHGLFLASLGLLLFAALTFAMSLFSLLLPVRVVLSLFLLIGAVCGYFTDQFGTVVDSEMLENVIQTDVGEVRDLITLSALMRVLLLGVVPIALVWHLELQPPRWQSGVIHHAGLTVLALVVMVATVLAFSDQYAGFFRERKVLRTYANPLMPIYSAIRYTSSIASSSSSSEFRTIAKDARIVEEEEEGEGGELIILVVGETARRDRFSLNGYSRETNPQLENEPRLVSYSNITSCGTSTAVSLPCMFFAGGQSDFSIERARQQENLLDILQRAGVNVLWRDNNSGSKGVAERVPHEDFRKPDVNPVCDTECRDVGMLAGLQEYIDSHSGDILIVLHQMGNHGPAYFKRYPAGFERFTPACKSLDLSGCSSEEINNAYDNAILYTDYFLSQVIALLKRNTPAFETAMLYVSDHGESLGEHGLYLHGAPRVFAPGEQFEVPVILWLGESADADLRQALDQKHKHNSHDAVFHTLLAAFEVVTDDLDDSSTLYEVSEQ